MNSLPPTVSVLMAVRNGLQYLEESVESILNQSFKDFEFIIIDDGSTDGTGDWLVDRARRDSRIRIVHQKTKGLTKSLNVGLALARGEFVARMDADDVALPSRLEVQVNSFSENRDLVALGTAAIYIDSKGRQLFIRQMPLTDEEIGFCHLTEWGGFLIHPTAMIKRSAMLAVGNYDESFSKAQDYDLWFRLRKVGRLGNLPDALLLYRYHNEAITQAGQSDQNSYRKRVLDRELAARGLVQPNSLPPQYEIYPAKRDWLLKAAMRSGFVLTTARHALALSIMYLKACARCWLEIPRAVRNKFRPHLVWRTGS